MIPKVNGQSIQLKVIVPIYEDSIRKKLFKKEKISSFISDIIINVWVSRDDIRAYGQFIENQEISKNRSRVYNRETGEYSIVEHTLEELEEALQIHKVGYKTS